MTPNVKLEVFKKIFVETSEQYNSETHYGEMNNQDLQQLLTVKHSELNQFNYMSEEEYQVQMKLYGDGYMGENARPGDLLWFDGECLCCLETVENYYTDTIQNASERNALDYDECAEITKLRLVLDTLEKEQQKCM